MAIAPKITQILPTKPCPSEEALPSEDNLPNP